MKNVKFILLFLLTVSLISGCAESSFTLSSESRLPKWFDVPQGLSRSELKVTLDYYVYPNERIATFKLYKQKGSIPLKTISGVQKGERPVSLQPTPPGTPKKYPLYEIITFNDFVDIVEHKKRESVFYMTDDPAVWEELGEHSGTDPN